MFDPAAFFSKSRTNQAPRNRSPAAQQDPEQSPVAQYGEEAFDPFAPEDRRPLHAQDPRHLEERQHDQHGLDLAAGEVTAPVGHHDVADRGLEEHHEPDYEEGDHEHLRGGPGRVGRENDDAADGPGHAEDGHGEADHVFDRFEFLPPRVCGPLSMLDLLRPAVGGGELAVEPVAFLTLQPVDPVQRGRTRLWMFRFPVHHRMKLIRGYSEAWDLRKNCSLHSMNGFSKVSRGRRHPKGWPNWPRLVHGSQIPISLTGARCRREGARRKSSACARKARRRAAARAGARRGEGGGGAKVGSGGPRRSGAIGTRLFSGEGLQIRRIRAETRDETGGKRLCSPYPSGGSSGGGRP